MPMTKRNVPAETFDPADQIDIIPTTMDADGSITITGTGELVNEQATTQDMYKPDTNGDPVGSEQRAANDEVSLPDFYYTNYDITPEGQPTFKRSVIQGIMEAFNTKLATRNAYVPTEAQLEKAGVVADGLMPLLESDPQATGLNFLQFMTKTWAEFASVGYEYQTAADKVAKDKPLPDYLCEREVKMFGLADKVRILDAALAIVGTNFGLNDKTLALKPNYVQTQVESRQKRLAEWSYKKNADTSNRNASHLNDASVQHARSLFARL